MDPNEKQLVEAYLQMVEGKGLLHDRFSNVKRIDPRGGGGHFSLVFTADDALNGEKVVLKFFRPDRYTPGDAYRWNSFERESKLLDELCGARDIIRLIMPQQEFEERPIPNVPLVIKFAYYAVERADGSLQDDIASGSLTADQLLTDFRVVTRSIQRIHAKRIAHRDLTPRNVLRTKTGLKLSDFGTARFIDGNSPALSPIYVAPPGDQTYVSPEMMACLHDVDPEFCFLGDFFALGAVLFEMFTSVPLGLVLFGPALLTNLTVPMINVPRDQRINIFDQIVSSLVSRYPIPTVQSLNPSVPPCIRQRLNKLISDLCCLNYRQRLNTFPGIFRGVDTCLLILRNQEHYRAWQEEKTRRRAARMMKMIGASQ